MEIEVDGHGTDLPDPSRLWGPEPALCLVDELISKGDKLENNGLEETVKLRSGRLRGVSRDCM